MSILEIEQTLVPEPGATLSVATLLRAFDDSRREIARRLSGLEGAFAGYDDIAYEAPVAEGCAVLVRASVTDVGAASHRVEYVAGPVPDVASVPAGPSYIRGRGLTLTPQSDLRVAR